MNEYTIAFLWGYVVMGIIANFLMKHIAQAVWEKTTKSYTTVYGEEPELWLNDKKRKPFNWAPELVGILERIFYTTAIVFNQFSLIAIWVAFKIIGEWSDFSSGRSSDEEGKTRIRANNFLIGSAFSLLLGVVGGVVFRLILNDNFLFELIGRSYEPTK